MVFAQLSSISLTRSTEPVEVLAVIPSNADLRKWDAACAQLGGDPALCGEGDRTYVIKIYVDIPATGAGADVMIGEELIDEWGSFGGGTLGPEGIFFKVYTLSHLAGLLGESITIDDLQTHYDFGIRVPSEISDSRSASELPDLATALGTAPYGLWHGLRISEDYMAADEGWLGTVYVRYDPWVYNYALQNWIYVLPDSPQWVWIRN